MLRQLFRQHAHVADHRHEVGVAVPARHQVHVQVIDDARAGGPAEVHADVDALRRKGLGQHALRQLRQQRHLGQLVARQRRQRGDVALRHHHQVAGVVGEHVEDDVGERAFVDDQLPAVVDRLGDAEHAVRRVLQRGSRRHAARETRSVPSIRISD